MASGDGNAVREELVKENDARSPVMKWLNPRWSWVGFLREDPVLTIIQHTANILGILCIITYGHMIFGDQVWFRVGPQKKSRLLTIHKMHMTELF